MPRNAISQTLTHNARARLAALREKKGRTKAAQVRALWPEIEAALDKGHSLKAVCDCLEADGLTITVQTLGSYLTRLRRKSVPLETSETARPAISEKSALAADAERNTQSADSIRKKASDPLGNIRERQTKRSAFDYRPELADPKELI